MKSRLVALCAILIPSVAFAQAPQDLDDPNAPAPGPSADVTVETTTPNPPPPPVVLVNPPPQQPRSVVVGPQYETVYDTYNAPVFTTGALVFLASYGASVIVAASADEEDRDRGLDRLYVPVVGPWLALNDYGTCPIERQECDEETTAKVLLVADGVFQAAGVITMISGILQPTAHRVPVRTTQLDKKVRVTPTTYAGTGAGLSMFGRF
jgi:hypothetical protein